MLSIVISIGDNGNKNRVLQENWVSSYVFDYELSNEVKMSKNLLEVIEKVKPRFLQFDNIFTDDFGHPQVYTYEYNQYICLI